MALVHSQTPQPPTRGRFSRPTAPTGWVSWLTTVDHKRIGILYGVTALVFLVIGGLEALLIRVQLAGPNLHVLGPETYNQLFTMHATTMIFLAVMPLSAAFFNYLIPLMIGARDVAFPRLNAFGYCTFLAGGILLNSSWFLGGAPNAGWFAYANLTSRQFNPGLGIDCCALGLQILGISSTTGALNMLVTIINLRAPGMSMMRPTSVCLDDAGDLCPHPPRLPGDHRGLAAPPPRPARRHHLFCRGVGWHAHPMAASVLGLRSSGGVYLVEYIA